MRGNKLTFFCDEICPFLLSLMSDLISKSELSECSLRTLRILDLGCCRGRYVICMHPI